MSKFRKSKIYIRRLKSTDTGFNDHMQKQINTYSKYRNFNNVKLWAICMHGIKSIFYVCMTKREAKEWVKAAMSD
ncbi:hypothetical protein AB8073_07505 [Providencia rettgeri]|nr:hypothetical protein [Providencia rettgeri]